jgi:zinc/manganese transport system substrate-binding protein
MRKLILTLLLVLPLTAQVKTVSLHPLITDIVKRVGGEHVAVIDLIGKNGDPHHFEPTANQLQETMGASLYFVSGKGLEAYLPSLKSIVKGRAKVIEVGESLPSIDGACDHCEEAHGEEEHSHQHSIDPHWWHSVDNFRRAVTVIVAELSLVDAAHAADFEKNGQTYRKELDELDRWIRVEIAKIPKKNRQLATAHAAFGYFCKEYQFTAFSVQGINREQAPGSKELADLIKSLKEHQVAAIFPEKESNPKVLETLTKDTGIALGETLIADGASVVTYDQMMRHNVNAIVKTLAP